MFIYIGYDYYYDNNNFYENMEVVFDSREKADKWVDEVENTETNYRVYKIYEIK